jgi:hypothetical protein
MTDGVITSHSLRTLTLADLGYSGATNANNYVHPSHPGDDISIDTTALTGATVISDLDFNITTDTDGHVIDANGTVATRNLTLADLGYSGATNATANAGTVTSVSSGTGISVTGTSTVNPTVNVSGDLGTIASATIGELNVDILDAQKILSRDIRVGPSQSGAATVGASTAAGSMTAGKSYIITSLGNTNNDTWSNLAGTPTNQFQSSGYLQTGYIEYSIGDIITISTANGSAGTGTGIELSGEGSHLNSDGDFLVGKVSTKNLMYFDSGIGQLMMGEIKVKEINDIVLTKGSGMSLGSNATPRNNCVYVGPGANGQGYGNTSVGEGAGSGIGFNNTSYATNGTAAENTTIGYHAGYNKISGSKNVFIGANVARVQAGVTSPSLSGDRNIGIGGHADGSEVTGGTCTFGNLSSGSDNVSIGSGSAQSLTTGSDNVFLGNNSGLAMTTGSNNVIIGTFSGNAGGYDIRTSSNNLVLADGAGNIKLKFDTSANATFTGKVTTSNSSGFSGPKFDTTDGTRFLQLSVSSGYNTINSMGSSSGSSQELRFTQGLSGTQLTIRYNEIEANDRIIITDTGVATTSTTPNIFSVGTNSGSTSYNYHMRFTDANLTYRGQITSNQYGTQYTTSSDYRLKDDVQEISNATSRLKTLNPVNFKWAGTDLRQDGFLAHEVSGIVPNAVSGEKDAVDGNGDPEYQGIDESKLVPLLVKTIQELEARITALENP